MSEEHDYEYEYDDKGEIVYTLSPKNQLKRIWPYFLR